MADNIHVIRVGLGGVNEDPTVTRGDVVVWVPMTTGIKVKVKFKDKTPFSRKEFPTLVTPGKIVSAKVRDDALDGDYEYGQPGSSRKLRRLADPVIIVRGDRPKTTRKKAPARSVARKK